MKVYRLLKGVIVRSHNMGTQQIEVLEEYDTSKPKDEELEI